MTRVFCNKNIRNMWVVLSFNYYQLLVSLLLNVSHFPFHVRSIRDETLIVITKMI